MKICVMTPSKSIVFIIHQIKFNEERTTAKLILNGLNVSEIDLTKCRLNKLDRTDGNMEYYEVVERTAQEVPVQEQFNKEQAKQMLIKQLELLLLLNPTLTKFFINKR